MNRINARGYMVMSYIALLAMAAIAAYDFVAPPPKSSMTKRQQQQSISNTNLQIQTAQKQLVSATSDVEKYVWKGNADAITSQSLKTITAIALKHRVQLVGLRPQKTTDALGLVQLPYLVLLNGAYKDVYGVIQDLQASTTKLAVGMIQFAAADESSDTVNATVTVVAYQIVPKEDASEKAITK